MELSELAKGDRVYRYWNNGAFGVDLQPLTVVRVNRVTATVRTDHGGQFRIDPAELWGHYTDEES